ncbi:hypothetical protein AQBE111736_00255 [Aquirufa beregesia]|uniref:hypothetical protein n=1 Tax=Aquirufa beregesia TaxID=2516556 RepID=UPI001408ECA0|nr:hypothetical protein [Aquirufa beregesia]
MNKDEQQFPEEKSNETKEKRTWVSPEISEWVSVNIGLKYGGAVDGGIQSYAT